jgi:D-alanyl-D-alanine carboxypeptidase/D-alanyl-D-alanine-endopeptidase (penicillin-binding protein 4)
MKSSFYRHRVLWLLCALLFARGAFAAPAPAKLPSGAEAKLRAILNDPALHDAHIGVSIVALGTAENSETFPSRPYDDQTQPRLFEADAQKRFMPASNVKLFTAALALQKLGAEHTFETAVAADAPVVDGEVRGNLYLIGGGDPSLSTSDLEKLAGVLHAQGIRRVTGDIIGDGSRFKAETFGGRYPDGWTLDDAIWYYGPEVSALAINRNHLDVTITGGDEPGQWATLKTEPAFPQFTIVNRVITLLPDEKTSPLRFDRSNPVSALTNYLTISGQIAPGQSVTEGVAVSSPEFQAAATLRDSLINQGVTINGFALPDHNQPIIRDQILARIRHQILARHKSAPLRILLQRLLKNSDNLYAEMLRLATNQSLPEWLEKNNISTANLRFEDGSGLSRYNLLTPLSLTTLLSTIEKLNDGRSLFDALPIAGRDGTLKTRMQSTQAAGNARAKTGSFSIANNLSGYVTTRDGHRLAVSVMTNFARTTEDARRVQDGIFNALAEMELPAK